MNCALPRSLAEGINVGGLHFCTAYCGMFYLANCSNFSPRISAQGGATLAPKMSCSTCPGDHRFMVNLGLGFWGRGRVGGVAVGSLATITLLTDLSSYDSFLSRDSPSSLSNGGVFDACRCTRNAVTGVCRRFKRRGCHTHTV